MPFAVRENEGLSTGGGSDHASYVAAGVPGFFWNQTGRAPYGFIHHTQNDTMEQVVPEYQRHSAMVVAIGAYNIASLDAMLDRTDLVNPNGGRRGGGGGGDVTRRRMGVQLEGTTVAGVVGTGLAAQAKWQAGDVILAIDAVKVTSMSEVVSELQKGGPKKVFTLKRGEATVESVLDYTGSASEKAREERAKKEQEAQKEQEAKKEGEKGSSGL